MFTIMVVDDEPDIREMVSKVMKEEGHDVISVQGGKDCFNILTQGQIPHLILLDIMMPEIDGWQVFKKLKETPEWSKIPVAFLTIQTDSFSKAFGKLLAQDFIEKPFQITDLTNRVKKILENPNNCSQEKEIIVAEAIKKI